MKSFWYQLKIIIVIESLSKATSCYIGHILLEVWQIQKIKLSKYIMIKTGFVEIIIV
jgi:hypothetical protein